jgi:hypothetical protein
MFSKISLLPHKWRDKNVLQNLPTTSLVPLHLWGSREILEIFLFLYLCGGREILENIFIPPRVW